MLRSFFAQISHRNATGYIAIQETTHRLHSETSDDKKKNHPSGWFLAMVDDDRIELPTSCL